ncbi:MAG TPA: AsmA family protein, partial [Verrucomicrobiae bacterium]|nr:AsmA family protein [Verrucomicrobiae bacterium]
MNQPNQPNQPMFIVAPPQKKRRRWLRFFAGLAVMVIILLVVVYFVATSPAFIKSVVLPRVGDALHANVTVSDISVNPFKQIALRDLTVQVQGQAPLLVVPEASIRYHLWDILGGNIHVDEIVLNSPAVELVQNPDGSSNLDPLLKALPAKPANAGSPKPKSSKASQIDLGKLTLRNASLVEIRIYGSGRSNVTALTNLDVTLANLKNGQSAALELSAALRLDENPPGGTNGFLAAAIRGKFNFALTPDLKPASASGQAQLSVSTAGGAFAGFSTLAAGLDC